MLPFFFVEITSGEAHAESECSVRPAGRYESKVPSTYLDIAGLARYGRDAIGEVPSGNINSERGNLTMSYITLGVGKTACMR